MTDINGHLVPAFIIYAAGHGVRGSGWGAIQAPSPDSKPDADFIHKSGEDVWFVTWGTK